MQRGKILTAEEEEAKLRKEIDLLLDEEGVHEVALRLIRHQLNEKLEKLEKLKTPRERLAVWTFEGERESPRFIDSEGGVV